MSDMKSKCETTAEDDLKEVAVDDISDDCVYEDDKSISLTTSTSLSSVSSNPHNSLKSSKISSNSDTNNDKVLSAKGRNSLSSDSSSSSSASSSTLPSNSCDVESDKQLSDCPIGQSVRQECDSDLSTTCSSLKPIEIPIKSNSSSLPASETSPSSPVGSERPVTQEQELCGSESIVVTPNNQISAEPPDSGQHKPVNGSERTFQSHFIESVLRNNIGEHCNTRVHEDVSALNNHSVNSSLNTPSINKSDNTSKDSKDVNSNSVSKAGAKAAKTSSSFSYSDKSANSSSASSKSSNSVKASVNESISQTQSQSQSSCVKRPSSPVSSNQSSASKQIRYSSPSSQTNNNSVPQSASNRSTINSLSSLSQLSQSIGQSSNSNSNSNKDRDKEREEIKQIAKITTPATNPSPQTTYAPIFSTPKSQLWSTSSSSLASNGSASGRHLSSPSIAPGSATPVIGLSPLHNNHLGMFASPIPPVSLPSVGGAVAPSATPSPFIGDSLFSHQNQSDFLRRELDTRFLASQDRTINIPPPPYMRPELHQHMHLPQSQPYPAAIGNSLVSASNSHLYEKYQKLDQTFYGRNALGLPGFPSLSPLLSANGSSPASQSGLTASANTPFGTPGHSAAFQPKQLNTLSTKAKPSVKSGRWCAMHVRIAWEIYHHQQKQHMDLSHKPGLPSGSVQPKTGSSSEMLRPLNHLFPVGTRTQDLPPFSSALLSAASTRAAFDSPLPSHHNQFGQNPSSPHLSNQTTNFPRFPTLGSFGPLNSSLNLTSVVPPPTPTGNLFGPTPISATRDLPIPGCLPGISASGPELWPRNVIPRPTSALMPPISASMSSSSSTSSSSSWGGLKAEAERNRDDIFKRKATDSVDKEAKRFERDKSRYEDRIESKHRDQSHSSHSSHSKHLNSSHLRNGDIYSDKHKDSIKSNNVRSPVHQSNHSHHNHHNHSSSKASNSELGAFDTNKSNSIGVKNEQKEELMAMSVIERERERERDRMSRLSSDAIEQKLKTNSAINAYVSHSSNASNLLNSSASLAAMGLNNQLEKARLMGLFGLQGTPPPMSPHFTANTPTDPMRSYWNPLMASADPFKSLHEFQMRADFLDRDNIFQRYSLLNSSGGGASLMEKLAKESAEKEMFNQSIEKHNNAKLMSHLRSTDTSFPSALGLHSPHTPHPPHLPPPQVSTPSSSSSAIFPANPYLNSLHSLSASAGSYVKSKTSSILHNSSSTSSSEPSSPSLGPPNGNLPALIPNVLNHSIHSSNLTNSKLSIGSLIDSPLEAMKDITHKTSDANNSSIGSLLMPNGNAAIDVLETNSR